MQVILNDIKCGECGAELDYKETIDFDGEDYVVTVEVQPCQACIDAMAEEGRAA